MYLWRKVNILELKTREVKSRSEFSNDYKEYVVKKQAEIFEVAKGDEFIGDLIEAFED